MTKKGFFFLAVSAFVWFMGVTGYCANDKLVMEEESYINSHKVEQHPSKAGPGQYALEKVLDFKLKIGESRSYYNNHCHTSSMKWDHYHNLYTVSVQNTGSVPISYCVKGEQFDEPYAEGEVAPGCSKEINNLKFTRATPYEVKLSLEGKTKATKTKKRIWYLDSDRGLVVLKCRHERINTQPAGTLTLYKQKTVNLNVNTN